MKVNKMATNKLYKITCKGMTTGSSNHFGIGYIIAEDPSNAYNKIRAYLDKEELGYSKERELDKIELIAEDISYPDCGFKLYL